MAQCIPIGNGDSSAGWDFFKERRSWGRIQIFTPHPSRIRLFKGGDLQNLVEPLENPFPILLSPSLVVTHMHIHTHTCVLTHKLTLSHLQHHGSNSSQTRTVPMNQASPGRRCR